MYLFVGLSIGLLVRDGPCRRECAYLFLSSRGGNDAATDTFLKAECQGFNICTMNSCVFMWWFDYGFVGS